MRTRIMNKARKIKSNLRNDTIEIKRLTVEKLAALITTGFGIVAAMAWNSAIQEFLKKNEWLNASGPWAYAIIITVIAVIITVWISKVSAKLNKQSEEEQK